MVQGKGVVVGAVTVVLGALGASRPSHAQVVNDDRAQAARVRPGETVTVLTAFATPSPDPLPSAEGCPFLGWSAPRKDVWYRFDPPQPDGFLTLDLCESNFDTSVVLYRLDPASGVIEQVACDDDDCNPTGPTYQSRITDLRLTNDPRPVLVRVAGWSNQVGTLRMRADWRPASETPVRFTSGGLFHDGVIHVGNEQASSQGPGTRGPIHAFVQGMVLAGGARAVGSMAAEVRSGWEGAGERVRLQGVLEASQPSGTGAVGRFRCMDAAGAEGPTPLELTLDADRYFRIRSSGSVEPRLVGASGCVCGNRLTAGTYRILLDAQVAVDGTQPAALASVDWVVELGVNRFREGDIDGNGIVNGDDLGRLLTAWGGMDGDADLDGDGMVDGDDLGILLVDWGP